MFSFTQSRKFIYLQSYEWSMVSIWRVNARRSSFPYSLKENYILRTSFLMVLKIPEINPIFICIFSELLNKGPLGVKVGVLGYGILSLISFSFPMNIIIKMFGHPCFISNLESNYIYIFNIFKFNFLLIYMKA